MSRCQSRSESPPWAGVANRQKQNARTPGRRPLILPQLRRPSTSSRRPICCSRRSLSGHAAVVKQWKRSSGERTPTDRDILESGHGPPTRRSVLWRQRRLREARLARPSDRRVPWACAAWRPRSRDQRAHLGCAGTGRVARPEERRSAGNRRMRPRPSRTTIAREDCRSNRAPTRWPSARG